MEGFSVVRCKSMTRCRVYKSGSAWYKLGATLKHSDIETLRYFFFLPPCFSLLLLLLINSASNDVVDLPLPWIELDFPIYFYVISHWILSSTIPRKVSSFFPKTRRLPRFSKWLLSLQYQLWHAVHNHSFLSPFGFCVAIAVFVILY